MTDVRVIINGTTGTLTLIWVGSLGVHVKVGGSKITPCLKLVRIMLEIRNLVRKYAQTFNFRKNTF